MTSPTGPVRSPDPQANNSHVVVVDASGMVKNVIVGDDSYVDLIRRAKEGDETVSVDPSLLTTELVVLAKGSARPSPGWKRASNGKFEDARPGNAPIPNPPRNPEAAP